jgi:hypothetical protein
MKDPWKYALIPHDSYISLGEHLNNPTLGLQLGLNSGLGINLQCAPTVCVSHEFLLNL